MNSTFDRKNKKMKKLFNLFTLIFVEESIIDYLLLLNSTRLFFCLFSSEVFGTNGSS